MEYTKLGSSKVQVSKICLGTMTFGKQNTETEGHEQLDYAVSQGINFIDTAEMYAIPATKETYGKTEEIIGTWLRKRGKRDDLILASKIVGPGMDYIRGGSRFNEKHIKEAVEGSLKRLQTDYIDLYQLHWPERKTNFFGRLGYTHAENDTWEENFEAILKTVAGLIKEGKIRYLGLSNETPWGTMKFLEYASKFGLPKIQSIQNPYNLLNRAYEVGMAEISHREHSGLLAYSPMAFGVLSGKYLDGSDVSKSRLTLFPQLSRYSSPEVQEVVKKYMELFQAHRVSPAVASLAYVNNRSFLTSNIIGATTMDQLKENISSIDYQLPEELLEGIEAIHRSHPNPAP